MCIWLPVSMFKLGSLMNTDDKSGVGWTICSCARFLLMLWPFFLIYALEKDNRPLIGENQIFLHISPLRKNTKFEFWLFPFIRAKSRFAPLCGGAAAGKSRAVQYLRLRAATPQRPYWLNTGTWPHVTFRRGRIQPYPVTHGNKWAFGR